MAKKKMQLGIPNPQSAGDVAAINDVLTVSSANATTALANVHQMMAHNQRMNMLQEAHLAGVITNLLKTDPVEAAAINAVVSPGSQPTAHKGPSPSDIAALADIIANANRNK